MGEEFGVGDDEDEDGGAMITRTLGISHGDIDIIMVKWVRYLLYFPRGCYCRKGHRRYLQVRCKAVSTSTLTFVLDGAYFCAGRKGRLGHRH